MSDPACFAPHEKIAGDLLPGLSDVGEDGSHDRAHMLRVWRNVQRISCVEGGDQVTLVAATILHECVAVPKNSAKRASASALSALKAAEMLAAAGWQVE